MSYSPTQTTSSTRRLRKREPVEEDVKYYKFLINKIKTTDAK